MLTKYGHPVCHKQLTAAGVISAGQVVQVMIVSICLPVVGQLLVFLTGDHLAFMRDCLDVVLVLMARLVQGMLKKMKNFLVWPVKTIQVLYFIISIETNGSNPYGSILTLPSLCLLPSLVSSGW